MEASVSQQTKRATKACSKCLFNKSTKHFYKDSRRPDGLRSDCKDCHNVNARKAASAWYAANPEKQRAKNIKWHYNVTPEKELSMLKKQEFKCADCAVTFSKQFKYEFDHDHRHCPGKRSCGACIRALLCHGCNTKRSVLDRKARKQSLSKVAA